jgi:NAD(P)-dependent dehydrogenase (short-subunit alcohol dehydrogenase family)
MAHYPSLQGRTVVVSGGADGIGAALVQAFAAQQAQVALLDIDAERAGVLIEQIQSQGLPTPVFAQCDLRDVAASVEALQRLLAGRTPHALLNNAGNDQVQQFGQVTEAQWDDRVAVNLRHQFFLAQAVAPAMRQARQGAIVNLGSISWRMGLPGIAVYSTMKAAVEGLTKALARELGAEGIRVNAIAPGWVLTERQKEKLRDDPGKSVRYLERQCLKQHLQPFDIAELALWLCADESRLCTGQVFTLDGGVV